MTSASSRWRSFARAWHSGSSLADIFVIRYSNARPLPKSPRFVSVPAGRSPRSRSSALARVADFQARSVSSGSIGKRSRMAPVSGSSRLLNVSKSASAAGS